RQNRVVEMRIGISFISAGQARRNLGDLSFDRALAGARKLWTDALGTIEVEGGSDAQRRIFYSALYRAQLMPHDLTGENVWSASIEPHYEDFYTIWDTFRTQAPLLTLIRPD